MQFPDFGPIVENKIYALRGLDEGSKLFKFIAGFQADGVTQASNMNLHYLALTMALVGGLTFFLIPKMRATKNIVCWLILVLVLIIGPYNNQTFFLSNSTVQGNIATLKCPTDETGQAISGSIECNSSPTSSHFFTPQVLMIDITSRIHRALHDSFFGEGGVLGKNVAETAAAIPSFKSMPQLTLKDRPDLKQETSIYTGLCSPDSSLNQLALAPYTSQSDKENALSGNGVSLSKEQSDALTMRTFTIQDVMKSINSSINNQTSLYHPIGLYYDYKPTNTAASSSGSSLSRIQTRSNVKNNVTSNKSPLASVSSETTYSVGAIYGALYGTGDLASLPASPTAEQTLVFNAKQKYESTTIKNTSAITNLNQIRGNVSSIVQPYSVFFSDYVKDSGDTLPWFKVRDSSNALNINTSLKSNPEQIKRASQASGKKFLHQETETTPEFIGNLEEQYKRIVDAGLEDVPVALALPRPKSNEISRYAKRNINNEGAAEPYLTRLDASVVHNCAQFHQDLYDRLSRNLVDKSGLPESMISGITGVNYDQENTYPVSRSTEEANIVTTNPKALLGMAYDSYISSSEMDSKKAQAASALGIATTAITNDDYREFVRKELLKTMIYSAFSDEDSTVPQFNPYSKAQDFEIDSQSLGENAVKNLNTGGRFLSSVTDFISDYAVKVGSWFKGGEVQAYLRYLRIMTSMALLMILMMTPLVMMMGLIIPSYAPGILILTIGSVFILKMIPAMFTIVDAAMTISVNMMKTSTVFKNDIDQALMIYVMATAYTSVVGATMWILFKSGDASQLSNLQQLDSAANKVADTAHGIAKGLAMSGVALAAAAATGGAGGALAMSKLARSEGKGKTDIAAAGFKGMISGSLSQSKEVLGSVGSNVPIVGDLMKQLHPGTSFREGGAYATEIDSVSQGTGKSTVGSMWAVSSKNAQNQATAKYSGAKSDFARAANSLKNPLTAETSEMLTESKEKMAQDKAAMSKKLLVGSQVTRTIEVEVKDKDGNVIGYESKTFAGAGDSSLEVIRDAVRKTVRGERENDAPDQVITAKAEEIITAMLNDPAVTSAVNNGEVVVAGASNNSNVSVYLANGTEIKPGEINTSDEPAVSKNVFDYGEQFTNSEGKKEWKRSKQYEDAAKATVASIDDELRKRPALRLKNKKDD